MITEQEALNVLDHIAGIGFALQSLTEAKHMRPLHAPLIISNTSDDYSFTAGVVWTDYCKELVFSKANDLITSYGGSHEDGLRAGIVRGFRIVHNTFSFNPTNPKINAEDLREGVVAVITATTKNSVVVNRRIKDKGLADFIMNSVQYAIEQWAYIPSNKLLMDHIFARQFLAARSRL